MKKDDLNKKQRYALDTMLSGSNVFLTGDAGTGKTTVIQTFIDEAEKAGKNILVSATTGIAADNIGYGATTVHRALNISIKFEDYKKKVKSRAELLKEADVLIIDEISMCRFDLFNMIAKTIITENEERAVDRLLIGEDKEDIQLIVIGDFYQLPPVITTDDRKILCRMYGSDYGKGGKYEHGYAFMSEYWKEMGFEYIKLDEVCRQNDEGFKYVLNDINLLSWMGFFSMGCILVGVLLVPLTVKCFGKKQVYLAGMVLWAVGDILNYFWGSNSFTFVMFSCVAFFGTAFVNSLNWALVPDTVDYGEWKTGIRAEGSVYTGYTFFRKISAALAGFLPGIMLTQIGYVPNIAQSDATLQGLRQLIFIWPCALAIIAALTMGFFYTLNEKRFALIIEEINQRKNKEMATEEKTASVTL